jgi:multiple sugar transport system ATP-binding protein
LDEGLRVPLGDARIDPAWLDREISVGIRPENLQPGAAGPGGFEAVVEVVEPVGNEVFLNLRYATYPLVARVAPSAMPAIGDRLALTVASDRLHFFDAESGRRLE